MCRNGGMSDTSMKLRHMGAGAVRLRLFSEDEGGAMQGRRMRVRGVWRVGVGGGGCGVLERASVEIVDEMCVADTG
jgi:hypothetical protein